MLNLHPNLLYILLIYILTLPQSLSTPTTVYDIFITPIYTGCNTTCLGTYTKPYDSLITVLIMYANQSASLSIILLPNGNGNSDDNDIRITNNENLLFVTGELVYEHFLLGAEYTPDNQIYYDYTNTTSINSTSNTNGDSQGSIWLYYTSLTIKPLLCEEYSKDLYSNCIDDDQSIKINLKFTNLIIFTESLNLTHVIIDGTEDIFTLNALYFLSPTILTINFTSLLSSSVSEPASPSESILSSNLTQCLYQRIKCCDNYDNITGYSMIFQDIYCIRPTISCPLLLNQSLFQKDMAMFNLQIMPNTSTNLSTFTLNQSHITNIWIPYRQSMNTALTPFILNIINSTIDSIFFDHGFMYAKNVKAELHFINSNYSDILSKFDNIVMKRPMTINNSLFEYHDANITHSLVIYLNNSKFHLGNVFGSIVVEKIQSLVDNFKSIFHMENTQFIGETIYVQNYTILAIQYTLLLIGFDKLTIFNSTFFSIIQPIKVKNCQNITIDHIIAKNNTDLHGGGLVLTFPEATRGNIYYANINNSIFENNIAQKGGGIYIGLTIYSINIILTNLVFLNNQAMFVGGAISIITQEFFSNDVFIIENCYFQNNTASYGGAIFLKARYVASGFLIKPATINIQIINNQFLSNRAIFTQFIFSIDDAYDQSWLPTTGSSGGASYILCYSRCNIILDHNIYSQNQAGLYGGALAITESMISNCEFIQNSASFGGGIRGIQSRYIIDPNSNYTIVNCTFDMNKAIMTINPNLINTLIQNQISKGGAISIEFDGGSNLINILNCNFSSNIASGEGGAINGGPFMIKGSYFYNNSANDGGALNTIFIYLTSSTFSHNHAFNNSQNSYLGQGGAIYLGYDTKSSIINTSMFNDNAADMSGGAIYFTSIIPKLDFDSIMFVNNTAGIYGNNLAAYAVDLVFWGNNSIEKVNLEQYHDGNGDSEDNTVIETTYYNHRLKAGKLLQPLNFAILDIYGQIVKEDSTSILTHEPLYNTSIHPNITFLLNPFTITASHGIYTYDIYSHMFYQPGLSINVSFKSSAITKSPWNQKTIVMNLTFDLCQTGEIFDTNQCKKCSPGFYSLENDPFYNGSCQVCDQNAICFGGNLISPKKGYWRMNSTANRIISCPQDDACLGSSFTEEYMTISGNCSNGYEGNLCGICSSNHGRTSKSFKCFDCLLEWSNYLFITAIFLLKIFIYGYLVKLTHDYIKKSRDNNNIIESKIMYMKIWINHWQLASTMKIFQIKWPMQSQRVLDMASSILITFSDTLFLDCNTLDSMQPNIYKFTIKIIADLALAILLVLLLLLLILIPYDKLKEISNRPFMQNIFAFLNAQKAIFITILIIFLLYGQQQVMILQSLSWFECINLYHEQYPEYYMYRYPQFQCWTTEHIKWSFTIGLILLIFWAILVPIIIFKMLNNNNHNDHNSTNSYLHNDKKSKKKPTINFIFLLIGYKKSFIYWEISMILIRLSIIISTTLLSITASRISILICIIIITVSLIIQRKYKPFCNKSGNNLQEYAYISLLIIYYSAMYCQSSSSITSDIILNIIIYGSYIGFGSYWVLKYLALYCKNDHRLWRILGKFKPKIKQKEKDEGSDVENSPNSVVMNSSNSNRITPKARKIINLATIN